MIEMTHTQHINIYMNAHTHTYIEYTYTHTLMTYVYIHILHIICKFCIIAKLKEILELYIYIYYLLLYIYNF